MSEEFRLCWTTWQENLILRYSSCDHVNLLGLILRQRVLHGAKSTHLLPS